MKDWFKDWFASGEYHKVYKHRDSKDAVLFWDTFSSRFNINSDAFILDAACGPGRYFNMLLEKNFKVAGFDLAMPLLKIARSHKPDNIENPMLFRADLREAAFRVKFDLILNMFTSFGYFESDEDNFRFITNCREYLTDNGIFVLDYMNETLVRNNLVPHSEKMIGDKKVVEERSINNGRVEKIINIYSGDDKTSFMESVKLYNKEELVSAITKPGYSIKEIWGSYAGEDFDRKTSERLIILFSL